MKTLWRWIGIILFCSLFFGGYTKRFPFEMWSEGRQTNGFMDQVVLKDKVEALPEKMEWDLGVQSKTTALEEFEIYVKKLFSEENLAELDQFRISRTIKWEEAAQWAADSPYFAHFASYPEYQFWSEGVILLQVDLNGDGKEDWIEYLPSVGRDMMYIFNYTDSLVIYLSNEKGEYTIPYYHSNFVTSWFYNDSLSVIYYQDAYFLIFEEAYLNCYEMIIYQVEEGVLTERLILRWNYGEVLATTLFCTEEQREMAELFCKEAELYYREEGEEADHLFEGNQETPIMEGSKEHFLLEQLERKARYQEKERWERTYQETYGKEYSFYVSSTVPSTIFLSSERKPSALEEAFQSDLDQDGEMEYYAKKKWYLGLEISLHGRSYFYRTGELYGNGKYEGKEGLQYVLVKDGKLIDFKSLCGLELWTEEYMPSMFWVEEEKGEVITYVKYYDEYYKKSLIEGYEIREGSYEKVLSVLYQPEILFTRKYQKKTEEEKKKGLTYMIYLEQTDETGYPKLYGLEEEQEKKLNEKLEEYTDERKGAFLEWYGGGIHSVNVGILSATKENVVFSYRIHGYYKWEVCYIVFMMDLETGEIHELEFDMGDLCLQKAGW